MSAPIQIVNDRDEPVGSATKQEAWQKGLWHRVVRIMLDDGKGSILLQHRSPTKDIYPNCWDNSSAGHVDAGETYIDAAYRELREELGLTGVQLEALGSYRDEHTWHGHQMKRFVQVYTATIQTTPKGNEPNNIDAVQWFSIADAQQLVWDHPDQVTDGLRQVIGYFYKASTRS